MGKKWIFPLSILFMVLVVCTACRKNEDNNLPLPGADALTTLDRTIVPDDVAGPLAIKPWDIALFPKYGYGKWHYGPGEPCQRKLQLMPYGYTGATATNSTELLSFFAITDIHIMDKETPTQAIYYSFLPYMWPNVISCYSPEMLYTTQTLDAAVRTINKLQKKSKFDFGIALGDMANSSQYNEIRWFIDVMDGKKINPDSGHKDDPIPGAGNDYQDEFQAEGLDQSIPWYATLGNHDHFLIGAARYTPRIKNSATGSEIVRLGNLVYHPTTALDELTYQMGTIDGSTRYGTIIGADSVNNTTTFPVIPADPDRRILDKGQMRAEFSNTSTLPTGHGFGITTNTPGCYTFDPKADLPLRVIVLDDTEEDDDAPPTGSWANGSLENGRFEWLKEQLDLGQQEGKLMIIAAHVPIGVEPDSSYLSWYPWGDRESSIIAELHQHSNVILWASGHLHRSIVTPFPSNDPDHPENGFWEVETKSLREFPQQFRTFRIVSNLDNTLSIFVTNVDPDVSSNPIAAVSLSYAIAGSQLFGIINEVIERDQMGKNYELIVALSPEMQKKIEAYRTKSGK